MPSPESLEIRATLEKEVADPSVTLAEERAAWDGYASGLPIAETVTLESAEIGSVPCAVLRPAGAAGNPVILYAHGGGLVTGSILTHRSFCSEMARATGCEVFLPDYRLLPDHAPSAPGDDLMAVSLALPGWMGDDLRPVFFGGDSSGAGLALSAMIGLRDRALPLPHGWFSISGAFDATLSGNSIKSKDAIDPILSEAVLRHWHTQLPAGLALNDPLISPLFADLAGLPPALLMAGTDEVWLDDSTRLNDKLVAAGSLSDMHLFDGMWHVWPMSAGLPETKAAFQLITKFLKNPDFR